MFRLGQPSRKFWQFLTFWGGLYILSGESIQAEDCMGVTYKNHRVGLFNFETNSRVESDRPYSKYITCVKNLDSTNDLRIHWYIPGPHNHWIPPGEIAPNERLSTHTPFGPLTGCIRYGNLTDTTTAPFQGHIDDKKASEGQLERQCLAQVRPGPTQDAVKADDPLRELKTRIKIFFPSNLSRPKETMLVLDGETILAPSGNQGYRSYFQYGISRYPGRPDGDARDVRIRAEFPGTAEKLSEFFRKENPPEVNLGNQKVTFAVESSTGWRLLAAFYHFIDKDNRVTASLQFPVFVPN